MHDEYCDCFYPDMSRAARSIYWFSFWVFLCGAGLLFFPVQLLALLGLDASASVVARLFGMVVLILAFYYFQAGRAGTLTDFYRWTTYTRPAAFGLTALWVLAGQASPLLLGFVIVDLLGALWTIWALRRDGPTRSP